VRGPASPATHRCALHEAAVDHSGYDDTWEINTMHRYQERITIEPDKRGGKPCIRGLRITVYEVLDYLASGMTEDEIVSDFPDLVKEDIRACLAFADSARASSPSRGGPRRSGCLPPLPPCAAVAATDDAREDPRHGAVAQGATSPPSRTEGGSDSACYTHVQHGTLVQKKENHHNAENSRKQHPRA
jgi:uncharacterized protein (DUF433 family)